MSYFLRRLPLGRLLLACALAIALGACVAALAFALDAGPTPPPKPLADAIHDALAGNGSETVQGVSASIQLTDHLLEGANLASGGQGGGLASSPLVTGASGRLWIAKDGRVRLELQSEQGDTQVLYDGHTLSLYDAATNTLYRYTLPRNDEGASENSSNSQSSSSSQGGSNSQSSSSSQGGSNSQSSSSDESSTSAGQGSSQTEGSDDHQEVPSLAKIEEAISHLSQHATVSGAMPTNIAGRPAYTVRVSPKEGGSLLGGAELSWDADNGVPLRAALYSSSSSSPVIELAATEISYGPVESSVFEFSPPPGAKVEEGSLAPSSGERKAWYRRHGGEGVGEAVPNCVKQALACPQPPNGRSRNSRPSKCVEQVLACSEPPSAEHTHEHPKLTTHGHGPGTIAVIEAKTKHEEGQSAEQLEDLPKVTINGTSASELRTALGTLLTFERAGVRYVVLGAVSPAAVEEVARGL
jgi:outer membrane lipoprotein-sorting protein